MYVRVCVHASACTYMYVHERERERAMNGTIKYMHTCMAVVLGNSP